MRRNFRSSKTRSGLPLNSTVQPGDFDVFAPRRKTNEMFRAVIYFLLFSFGEIDSEDRGKMRRPLRFVVVSVAAGGNDVNTFEPGFVRPLFVGENKLGHAPAAKAAVQNVVATSHCLANAGADEVRPGNTSGINDTKASNLSLGCIPVNDVCDCGSVTERIVGIFLDNLHDSVALFKGHQVDNRGVGKAGMVRFDTGVNDSHFHPASGATF